MESTNRDHRQAGENVRRGLFHPRKRNGAVSRFRPLQWLTSTEYGDTSMFRT